MAIPSDAEDRLTRLNGVTAAGALGSVDVQGALVRSVPIPDPLAQTEFQISIYAATPGRTRTPVLDPWVPLAAPLVGAVTGLYPALRAARLEPVEALRSG